MIRFAAGTRLGKEKSCDPLKSQSATGSAVTNIVSLPICRRRGQRRLQYEQPRRNDGTAVRMPEGGYNSAAGSISLF